MARGMTMAEVLESNMAVCADEETGIMVTINGSYLQVWSPFEDGSWDCRDCRCTSGKSYASMTFGEIHDVAAEYLDDVLNVDCPECGESREKNADSEWKCPECDDIGECADCGADTTKDGETHDCATE